MSRKEKVELMDDFVVEKIKEFAIKQLKENYGYCAVAETDTFVMLSSDNKKGKDIKITIKLLCRHGSTPGQPDNRKNG